MKRGKTLLVWIGIVSGALVVFLLLLAGGFYWIAGRPLARRLAELREAGEPVCLKDLERKPVPEDQNGVTYLLEAKAEIEAVEQEIYAIEKSSDGKNSPADMEKIHAILAAHPKILPLVQKAAAAPEFQFPLDYHVKPSQFLQDSLLPLVSIEKGYISYLNSQADDLLLQGKRDEALQTAVLMMQLTRQYDRDSPTLTFYLMNIACKNIAMNAANKILQSGPVGSKQHAALEAELAKLDTLESCRVAMKTERAYSLDATDEVSPSLLNNQWKLCALEMFDDFFKYSNQPYATGVNKMGLPSNMTSYSLLSGPAKLMLPACKSTIECAFRSQASVRALRIINALQSKASAEGDKIPGVAELGLPKEVGIDPFNGQAMIVKKTPEGWLVYSVGRNLQDDGGKLGVFSDVGFGPKKFMAEEEEKGTNEKTTE
jgi:hypothetical protein